MSVVESPPGAIPPPRVRDRGLQAERTLLAWSRTALAVLANALVALRAGWVLEQPGVTLLAGMLFGFAAAMFCFGLWRRRALLNGQRPVAVPAAWVRVAAVLALTTCAIGLAAVVAEHVVLQRPAVGAAHAKAADRSPTRHSHRG
jgi:uncharacterized membrane protein YidH (DUF202 family)